MQMAERATDTDYIEILLIGIFRLQGCKYFISIVIVAKEYTRPT